MRTTEQPTLESTTSRVIHRTVYTLILLFLFFLTVASGRVFAIEFVTSKAFESEKSAYKDYPMRVLFEKLHESEGAEKRTIRNIIILKQVFDPQFLEKTADAGVKWHRYYGVVKSVNGEQLRLWVPEHGRTETFHVGFDRIPLVNDKGFDLSPAGIGKFAAVAYVLDNRIYQIEIRFELRAPTALRMERRGESNVITWKKPESGAQPLKYKVFVNKQLFKSVARTTLEVPRERDRADEFFVKAVYTHQNGFIDSEASDTLYDQATADEIVRRQKAMHLFEQIKSALNPSEWQEAKNQLYKNRRQLEEWLDADRRSLMSVLIAFFRRIDEGDRLASLSPKTKENLSAARKSYRQAAEIIADIPEIIDISFIHNRRIGEIAAAEGRLSKKLEQKRAKEMFQTAVSSLSGARWRDARKILSENFEYLSKYLDTDQMAVIRSLSNVFKQIEAGDRTAAITPLTEDNLQSALASYRGAEEAAKTLPAGVDAGFIARLKITKTQERIHILKTDRRKAMAQSRFQSILDALATSNWQAANRMIDDHRPAMDPHIDDAQKETLITLKAVFDTIAAGDRTAAISPLTEDNLQSALVSYRQAEKIAKTLPAGVDAGFITRLKITDIQKRIRLMEADLQKAMAQSQYQSIIDAVAASNWQAANKRIDDHRPAMDPHLDDAQKETLSTLKAVFDTIAAGDRTASISPLTEDNLQSALVSYRQAEETAKTLPSGVDAGFIARLKIADIQKRIQLMEADQQKAIAQTKYRAVLDALAASNWQAANQMIDDHRPDMDPHLDDSRKETLKTLKAIFNTLARGDRTAAISPLTEDNLQSALASYRQAEKIAKTLPSGADAGFIARVKITDIQKRIQLMEADQQKAMAQSQYQSIIDAVAASNWQAANKRIDEHRPAMDPHLDDSRKETLKTLKAIFNTLARGDRAAAVTPATQDNLKAAMDHYRKGEEKARILPESVDAARIIRNKIIEIEDRMAELAIGMQKRFAEKTYLAIIDNLTPDDWQTARRTLLDNLDLLSDHLDPRRKAGMETLAEIFREIETADRTAGKQPISVDQLNTALKLYRWAEAKARTLPEEVKAGFIVRLKIDETRKRMMAVETGMQKQLAVSTYRSILDRLTTTQWKEAWKILAEQRDLLHKHLDPEERSAVETLETVFNEIDAGDRTAAIEPPTLDNLRSAKGLYEGAGETAATLPSGIDAGLIARVRITELQNRIRMMETEMEKKRAEKTYLKILASLSPESWQKAKKLLQDHRELLFDHLNPNSKAVLKTLIDVFNGIEAGERTAAIQPLTVENLRQAMALYEKAEAKANSSQAVKEAGHIAQIRLTETRNRIRLMESGKQQSLARSAYQEILAGLTPENWQSSQKHLIDNRSLLDEHLDEDEKTIIKTLWAVFKKLDAGDRTAAARPQTVGHLESAIAHFQEALEKAENLPTELDAGLIARLKIREARGRIREIETGKQRKVAQNTYRRILGDLTPDAWQDARKRLSANRGHLDQHLAADRKGIVKILDAIFRDVEVGDQTEMAQPSSVDNLRSALDFYKKAEEKAKTLPAGVDAGFLPRLKINRIEGRIERIQSGQQKQFAEKQYSRILLSINPSDWKKARSQLYDHHLSLAENLTGKNRETALELIAFFKDIDEGDRLSGTRPETLRDLALADRFYQRADQKARLIKEDVDVGFIAQQKIAENRNLRAQLEEKQQKTSAGKAYERTVSLLNPDGWESAKTLLADNQLLMLAHLESQQKKDVLGLIEFFRDLDEGDRLVGQTPETEKNLDTALSFYERAKQRAVPLEKRLKIAFIADRRIAEAKSRIDQISRLNQRQLADKTYDQIMKAFNPEQWQAAKSVLLERKTSLLSHLDSDRQRQVKGLLAFFSGMDEGDRLLEARPQTEESLEKALARYELAGLEISEMPDIADHAFMMNEKRAEVQNRKSLLARQRERQEAGRLFEKIIRQLTPDLWTSARTELTTHETRLLTILGSEQQQAVAQLISFFRYVDEGDRLTAETPETRENLEMALSSYRLAEQKLGSLAGIGDLAFITEEKLKINVSRREALEVRRKAGLAVKTYNEMAAALNPDGWETAKEVATKKLKLLTAYLDSDRAETAGILIDFFTDIDESDSVGYQRPESIENYDKALLLLAQAEEKAIALSSRVDVIFITDAKKAEYNDLKEALAQRERAIVDAQQAQQMAEAPSPVRRRAAAKTEAFDDSVDSETALKLAVANFDSRKYSLSLRYFRKVYAKQIKNLQRGGKRQVMGLLALPPAIRAEVTFLVQLSLVMKKSAGNEDLLRDGLQDILDGVDGSSGPWSIIPEAKKNRIRRHIENYRF